MLEVLRAGHQNGDFTGDVHIAGGGKAVQSMLRAGAVDRLHLTVLPILVGAGVPLFDLHITDYSSDSWTAAADKSPQESLAHPVNPLELRSSRSFDDGVVELVYAPVARPETS